MGGERDPLAGCGHRLLLLLHGTGHPPAITADADPHQQRPVEEEARLFHMAMTRAIDQLVLTYDRQSLFVDKLQMALATLLKNAD